MRTLIGLTAALCLAATAVCAQDSIVGVWRSEVEGQPSGLEQNGASDVQTLTLGADGQYRREISVEGADNTRSAGGGIIDAGAYRFTPPSTFEYQRRQWLVCTFAGCQPGQPLGPNQGALPFQLTGAGRATFLGLSWTRIR